MTEQIARLPAILAGRFRIERLLTPPKVTARTEVISVSESPTANPNANLAVVSDGRFVLACQAAITLLVMIEDVPTLARRRFAWGGRP